MTGETVRDRADALTLGGLTLESGRVKNASLETAYEFAGEFIKELIKADRDLGQALIASGLTDQQELRLVRDYFQSALRPKGGIRSDIGQSQAQTVSEILGMIRPKIEEENRGPVKVKEGRFPGRGKRRPAGHGPYHDEGEF